MGANATDRLQGTLDLLILRVLRHERMHGWGIAIQIQQISRDVLQVNQGSLYPALRRLEERGWIAADWGTSENNRRARYYTLRKVGRQQLQREVAQYDLAAAAIARILKPA